MALLNRLGFVFLLLATVVALLYNIDPSDQGFGTVANPVLKYLPYTLSAVALLMFLVSIQIRLNVLSILVFLFLFLMLLGSLYALLFLNMPLMETYLGRALGGIVFAAFYWLSFHGKLRCLFFNYYCKMFLMASLTMAFIMVMHSLGIGFQSQDQMYHVQMPAIIAAVFLVPILITNSIIQTMLVALLIIAGLVSTKASCILTVLLSIVWYVYLKKAVLYARLRSVPSNVRRLFFILMSLFGVASVVFFSLLMKSIVDNRLAERSNDVRDFTSAIRWNEFFSSPFYGDLFTGSPLLDIGFLHIPSHSDLLDLLAFGGLITLFLFYLPVVRIVQLAIRSRKRSDLECWFAFCVVASILTMAVNPFLSVPRMGFIFFASLGFLFGALASGEKINHS